MRKKEKILIIPPFVLAEAVLEFAQANKVKVDSVFEILIDGEALLQDSTVQLVITNESCKKCDKKKKRSIK